MLSMLGSVGASASMDDSFRSFIDTLNPQELRAYQDIISDRLAYISNQAIRSKVYELIRKKLHDGRLDLYNNEIGKAGAVALADALKTNTSISRLNLQHNRIGEELRKRFRKIVNEKCIPFFF